MPQSNFIPIVGMIPKSMEGNGYKGVIEYVGHDYFILRSDKTGDPVLIRPFQYHNFKDYIEPESKYTTGKL